MVKNTKGMNHHHHWQGIISYLPWGDEVDLSSQGPF